VRPPSPEDLRRIERHERALEAGTVLWRIHSTASAYPMAWNGLRTFGPLPSARWDPHPEPAADHSPLGAAYFGRDLPTCLAEVYQDTRFVDVDTAAPYATAIETASATVLLDLTDLWLVRAGAKAALAWSEEKAVTRAWAQAIHEAWPDLGGVVAPSAVAGREVVVLWTTQPFPAAPSFSVPLNHPGIAARMAAAAELLNFTSNLT
jgi:hypothetical protein